MILVAVVVKLLTVNTCQKLRDTNFGAQKKLWWPVSRLNFASDYIRLYN